MNRRSLLLFLFLSNVFPLISQTDTHYWTHQYGSKGLLLNGAVIASTEDETAIFYNPGAMAEDATYGISFSFLTPTFSIIKTNNFLGDGTSFDDKGFDLAPGFLAIRFKPFKTDNLVFGVTTFTRLKSDLKFRDRVVGDVSNNADQVFAGNLEFERKLSQQWFGFGVAYKIKKNFSIGATQYMIWHGENVRLNFHKEIVDRDDPFNLVLGWRSNFKYGFSANAGFLTKVGLAWQPGKVKIGATLTTPSYSYLLKNAEYDIDEQRIYGQDSSKVISNLREIPLDQYKTPLSVGFGIDFAVKKYRISFSAEYFASIFPYSLFNDKDDPFDGNANTTEEVGANIVTGNQSVLNVAFGVQKTISERWTMLYGFRTDFNQNSNFQLRNGVSFLASTPDEYHVSAGTILNLRKNQLAFGFDYGFGFKTGGEQLSDLTNITAENLFTFAGERNVKTFTHSFMIFMTYDFLFKGFNRVEE